MVGGAGELEIATNVYLNPRTPSIFYRLNNIP